MRRFTLSVRCLLSLLLLLVTVGVSGCATTEDTDNASVRPWNAPKGWETGLPTQMYDRR